MMRDRAGGSQTGVAHCPLQQRLLMEWCLKTPVSGCEGPATGAMRLLEPASRRNHFSVGRSLLDGVVSRMPGCNEVVDFIVSACALRGY